MVWQVATAADDDLGPMYRHDAIIPFAIEMDSLPRYPLLPTMLVNPDDIVGEFGADSMRVYEMFMGPLEATKPWNTSSIAGVRRFLDRVYTVTTRADASAKSDTALTRLVHQTIRKVTEDIEGMRFNTAISAMMVLTNELMKLDQVPPEPLEALAKLVVVGLHHHVPELVPALAIEDQGTLAAQGDGKGIGVILE